MAMSFAGLSKPFAATRPVAARKQISVLVSPVKRATAVVVKARANDDASHPVAAVSAFAASLLILSSTAFPAAAAKYEPAATTPTAGKEETERVVSKGTPDAAKATPMQTNIPFQAPGSNRAPRGPTQEQGTNVQQVLKRAGKQIKENNKDPDSKPFGVGRGPLVRSAQKMNQPGKIERVKESPTEVFKQQSSFKKEEEDAMGKNYPIPRGYYRAYDKISEKLRK